MTGELQRLLSEADRALGRLDGSIQILPDADMFIYMYMRNVYAQRGGSIEPD